MDVNPVIFSTQYYSESKDKNVGIFTVMRNFLSDEKNWAIVTTMVRRR